MPRYSQEFQEHAVRQLMAPLLRSVAEVSRETGVSAPTLYAWKKRFQEQGDVVPARAVRPEGWDAKARLAAVIRTAALNEAERSVYCREHGLYVEQLEAWKAEFESMDDARPVDRQELAQARRERRELHRELTRKEKALAETAALLALSKKAQAIWGTGEED